MATSKKKPKMKIRAIGKRYMSIAPIAGSRTKNTQTTNMTPRHPPIIL